MLLIGYRFIPEGPDIKLAEYEKALKLPRNLDYDYIVLTGSLPNNAPLDAYPVEVRRGVVVDCWGATIGNGLHS